MSYNDQSHKFRLYKAMYNTSITLLDFDFRHFSRPKTKSTCTRMMPGPIGIGRRHRIIALAETGRSQQAIAENVGVTRETVNRILKRNRETGSVDPGRSTGRPRASTERQDRVLRRIAVLDRSQSCNTLRTEWGDRANVHVSRRTVNGRLLQMGYRSRKCAVKPKLTQRHRRDRLAWAMQYRNLTVQHWQHVVFADESRFPLFVVDGRRRVRRLPGERLNDDCVQNRVAGGGGSVHVWGAFCATAKSELVILDANVNGAVYSGILEQNMLPWARRLFGDNFRFQDDNAPAHRARVVTTFLEEQDVTVLRQPALSPDLNPIEHLWDELGRAVRRRDPQPTNLHQLRQILVEEWNAIPQNRLAQLVDSMPRRLADVIAARGGYTRY